MIFKKKLYLNNKMTMLNLNELYRKKEEKIKKKLEIYDNVLKKLHQRIKNVANNSIECYCFYVIPNYIFGIPNYNKNDCIKYIFNKLTQNGFKILYTNPNLFFISWEHIKPTKKYIEETKKDNKNTHLNTDTYKPTGNFIYGDQLSKFKHKSKFILN